MASEPSVQCAMSQAARVSVMRTLLLILGILPALTAQQSASANGETPVGLHAYPYVWQGMVQAGVAGFAVNLPASNAPSPTNSGGAMPIAVLEWPAGQSTYYAWWTWVLPAGYPANAAIRYSVESRCKVGACDSTHANIVTLGVGCAGGAALDASAVANARPINITNGAAAIRTVTAGTLIPNQI